MPAAPAPPPNDHAHDRAHGRAHNVGRRLSLVVWLLLAAYLALLVLRVVAFDQNRFFAAANSLTLWLLLPAYAIASAALLFRRFVMAGGALLVVVFHLVVVGPSIGVAEPIPDAARSAPQLRIVSANIAWTNPTPDRLTRELLETDADVLLLQEVTLDWIDLFERAGLAERYRYSVKYPLENSMGAAIYSRLPLDDVVVTVPARNPGIAADVTIEGETISLLDVHVVGPREGMTAHRRSAAIVRELAQSRAHPLVVGGDFNASPYNRTMRQMEALGLDSAHERRGRGLAATWPNGERWLPPIRIDHVLVADPIVVLDVRELRGSGSDHRPVQVDLALVDGD